MSIEINGTGVITGVDSLSTPAVTNAAGSASSPTITFTGDTNTGLYSPGADQVAVTTGGTARLFVDASGRLLVGTSTSRGGWFNTSGQDSLIQTETTTQNVFSGVQNSNSALGPWILLGKSRGTTAGAVTVVQNDDPLGGITFQGADGTEMVDGCRIQAFVDGTPGANDLPTRLVFSTTADGASSPTERMRITNGGTTSTFTSAGNAALWVGSASAAGTSVQLIYGTHSASGVITGTNSFTVWTNGNVVNTNNSYGSLSDIKLKENIVNASSQWNDLKALQIRKYNLKEETGQQTHTQIGLIAQEVELVSPGLVSESPDRDAEGNDLGTVTKSVNYSVLYMKAVKALQEAMERIETLEADVAALKAS